MKLYSCVIILTGRFGKVMPVYGKQKKKKNIKYLRALKFDLIGNCLEFRETKYYIRACTTSVRNFT